MTDVGAYAAAFSDLLASGTVQAELARAFLGEKPSSEPIADVWRQMGLRLLPLEFDWQPVLKNFEKTIATASGQNPTLKGALDTLNLNRIADNMEASLPRAVGYNLAGYRKALVESHGYLKLQQLAAEAQNKTPISMRKVFVDFSVIEQGLLPSDFYCLPIEDQSRLREGNLKEHHVLDGDTIEQFTELLKKANAEKALAFATSVSHTLVVLTGDPGSGKSTLLQYLALEWAESTHQTKQRIPVPFIVELRRYAEQREKNLLVTDFPSFLQHGTDQAWQLDAKNVDAALSAGDAWLFLDGLDEVFDSAMRDEIVSLITRAKIAWPSARIIVTTRSYGYKPEALQQAGFQHGHVQPFDDRQIALFLSKWHEQIADPDRDDLHSRLKGLIRRQPRSRELAGNPLLLTMMALLNRTSNLPDRRAELYSRCVDLLVHQWEVEVHRLPSGPGFGPYAKDSRQLSLDEKRSLLRAVAFHMHTTEGALALNVIASDSLEQSLAKALPGWIENCDRERISKELVEKLQGRNYILASLGAGRFGFVHRTFLEFCCADHFLFQLKEDGSISDADFFEQTFATYWQKPEWSEILNLMASQLAPSRLNVALLRMQSLQGDNSLHFVRSKCFAARMLGEAKDRNGLEEVGGRLWGELTSLIEIPLPQKEVGEIEGENVPFFGPFKHFRVMRSDEKRAKKSEWTQKHGKSCWV